ncbi:MAG: thiamine pyrophosphate-binding protein, partial [Verrucomicrobiales bacterium]
MFAQTVLQACLDLGVRDFCVCAGSRNSDLVHGLLQNRDKIRILPFFEERSAAFFGLGLLQIARTPVAIVTTSGTAVAELLPAVIEAYYQARPLLLITADRPKRYRGSGAPQAIDQSQLFGIYARAFDIESDEDVIDLTTLTQDQPIHLNVCLEEPSAAPPQMSLSVSASTPTDLSVSSTDQALLETFLQQDSPLLVIAGCLNPHEDLINTLLHLKAPILADATSGLHAEPRLHSLLIRGGDQTARRLAFSRVLRIGGVPSFRTWRDLETKPEVEVFSLTQRPFSGLARPSQWIMGDTFPLKRSQ